MENLIVGAIVQTGNCSLELGRFFYVLWHYGFWTSVALGLIGTVAAFFVKEKEY